MDLLIINGPNLNLLGRREPGIYGSRSFDDFFPELVAAFPDHALTHFQSNHEGALIDKLHEVGLSLAAACTGTAADTTQAAECDNSPQRHDRTLTHMRATPPDIPCPAR